jgi:hypothetical protein
MTTPSSTPNGGSDSLDLCDAILGNSACLVDHCLTIEHKNPNYRPKLALFDDIPKSDDGLVDETERILGETIDYTCAPLHVAIVNCYHHGRMDGIAQKQRENSLRILDLLLEAGADASATCNQVLFCNVGDLNISSPGAPLDTIALTLSLKKVKQSSIHADERMYMMDEVMERLVKARMAQRRPPNTIPQTSIPALVASTYSELALSSQYSDVTIVCLDGVELPAHCNVLAVASPILKAALPKDGSQRLAVNRSSKVMRSVLRFMYTGQLDDMVLEQDTATLLSIAAEYQLEALEQVCAQTCGKRLTLQNVRIMLDIGERHGAVWIKKECLDFLQRQPLPVVLGHPKLLALAKDNPKLWQELLMAVGGDYSDKATTDTNKGEQDKKEMDAVVERL